MNITFEVSDLPAQHPQYTEEAIKTNTFNHINCQLDNICQAKQIVDIVLNAHANEYNTVSGDFIGYNQSSQVKQIAQQMLAMLNVTGTIDIIYDESDDTYSVAIVDRSSE